MEIKKKTWSLYFQKVLEGKKTFDLRLADWKCKEGDILILQEWDPETKKYTGRELRKEVTYVLKTKNVNFFSKEDVKNYGYQVIGFK